MFHRIDMHVIDMACEIVIIPDRMLPIAPLPDAAFAFCYAAFRNPLPGNEAAREGRLDQPPPGGKGRVALRQRPDCVQVIRKHNHRVDGDRMPLPRLTKRGPQIIDVVRQQL